MGERFRLAEQLLIARWDADYDARGMQVVVKSMPLSQEFRREEDFQIWVFSRYDFGVPYRNRRFDHDASADIKGAQQIKHGLNGAGVKIISCIIVIGWGGNHDEVRFAIAVFRLTSSREIQVA